MRFDGVWKWQSSSAAAAILISKSTERYLAADSYNTDQY